VGFGVYSPFGLGAKWSSGADIVLDPRVPYEADLVYSKYHVVVAWKATDELSLSSGLSYDYTDIQVKSNALEYEGNDNTLGFSIAALWQPSPQHSFGLNYQAKTEVTYDGTSTIVNIGKYKSKSDLTYPESIIFGYSFRPNQKWNIELNVDWTNWDRVDDLVIEGLPSVLGAAPSYELKWNSSFIWELGATHYLKDGWIISAGYTFIENSVPEKTLLPIVPDSDRHAFSIGFGRDHGKMYWQVTCQYIYGIDRKIGNNVYESVNGDYELDSYGAAFSVGYRF
jgi:long-chain fatty acid transport protein